MITRVNAAARKWRISYSKLIYGMKKSNIELNRKSLSLLAFNDFDAFEKIVDEVKSDLN